MEKNPFSTAFSPIFIPIPHFVFENMSPELEKFITKCPSHKTLTGHCKPSRQLKLWKKYCKTDEN